jgi:DNA polymerase-1
MDGKKLLDNFHSTRPGIKLLRQRVIQRIDDVGYITTPWGSRLHPLEDHKSLNVLIQGCAADLMRHAIREVSAYCRIQELVSHIVNVVHDELMLDCIRGELLRLHENIPRLMNYEPLNDVIPIKTSVEIAYRSWADKELYDPTIVEAAAIMKG